MDKNNKNSRPLSPHLTIYKPQISSVLSIGHRMSGFGLFVSLSLISWWCILFVSSDFDSYYISIIDNIVVKFFLIIVSYGFFYHLCTGIRHLIWDTGNGFSIKSVHISGWIAIIASFFMTFSYWFFLVL